MDDFRVVQIFHASRQVLEQLFAFGIGSTTFALDVVQEIPVLRQLHHDEHLGRKLEDLRAAENVLVVDALQNVQLTRQKLFHKILSRIRLPSVKTRLNSNG